MFGLNVIPAKVKEMVDALEEGYVFLFEEAARDSVKEGRAFYDDVYECIIVPFKTFDWSSVTDEEINAFMSYNKNTAGKFIKGIQVLIDALYLAIERSEKRKDIDYVAKKRKYLGFIGLFEQGKKYYAAGLIPIPEQNLKIGGR